MAKNNKHDDANLKGSFWATLGIGLVIIVIWVFSFSEFISRF